MSSEVDSRLARRGRAGVLRCSRVNAGAVRRGFRKVESVTNLKI